MGCHAGQYPPTPLVPDLLPIAAPVNAGVSSEPGPGAWRRAAFRNLPRRPETPPMEMSARPCLELHAQSREMRDVVPHLCFKEDLQHRLPGHGRPARRELPLLLFRWATQDPSLALCRRPCMEGFTQTSEGWNLVPRMPSGEGGFSKQHSDCGMNSRAWGIFRVQD